MNGVRGREYLGPVPRPSSEPVYLSGWGSFHPSGQLTNQDIADRLDTSVEWISRHIGIESRCVAGPEDTASSMGARALSDAIAQAGCRPQDVGAVISATSFDVFDMPSTASRIAAHTGIEAFTFDVRAACSGWLVGIELARGLLHSGRASHVAVCAAEQVTLDVDPDDRATVVFFGDAAAAAIVQSQRPDRGLEVVDFEWGADNAAHDAVVVPHGGYFTMDARRTRTWVEQAIESQATEILERNGLSGADLRALVCHQANLRLLEWVSGRLGVPASRHWHNVEWAGNTSAAGAPSTLAQGLDNAEPELEPGDLFLVVTVGSGLNVAAALLRWMGE